jgi:hypothetical protein
LESNTQALRSGAYRYRGLSEDLVRNARKKHI